MQTSDVAQRLSFDGKRLRGSSGRRLAARRVNRSLDVSWMCPEFVVRNDADVDLVLHSVEGLRATPVPFSIPSN